jgi:hypothetical protein
MRAFAKPLLYILVSFFSLTTACHNQPSDAVTKLDQIRPKSIQKDKQTKMPKVLDTLSAFLKTYANDSASLRVASLLLDTNQNKHFLNRFSRQHFHLLCTDSTANNFSHQEWTFKDSSQAKEAFYNWIEQFETNAPFKIGSKDRFTNQNEIIVVANKTIIVVSSKNKISVGNYLKWLNGKYPLTYFNYVLLAQPRKSTAWYQFKNAKLSPQ